MFDHYRLNGIKFLQRLVSSNLAEKMDKNSDKKVFFKTRQ